MANASTPVDVEAKALLLLSKIENRESDSLQAYNIALIKILSRELRTAESMNYSFSKLEKKGMRILKSTDNRLRVFCWDDNTGGTARGFNVIAQFSDGKKVFTDVLNNAEENEFDACSGSFSEDLRSVQTRSGAVVYLLRSRTICSSAYGVESINAYTITAGTLTATPFFKTAKHLLRSIYVEYDFSTQENRDKNRGYPQITFSDNADIMYVPIIKETSTITNRNLKYRFDGTYYVFEKN